MPSPKILTTAHTTNKWNCTQPIRRFDEVSTKFRRIRLIGGLDIEILFGAIGSLALKHNSRKTPHLPEPSPAT